MNPTGRISTRRRSTLAPTIALLAIGLLAALAHAQSAPDEYRVGKYDVLVLTVAEEQAAPRGISAPEITVGPDGCINVLYVGTVRVLGKTCAELSREIADGLIRAGQYVHPNVLVRVKSFGAENISVLGAVEKAGYFPFRTGMTIREAIALAGGVKVTVAENGSGSLVRADGTSIRFGTNDVQRGEGPAGAVTLEPGDTIVVELRAPATVTGYVRLPGAVPVREGALLSEVIGLAGGVTEDLGDASRITINRADGTVLEANLALRLARGTGDDPPIHPGDTVFVPRLVNEATVLGFADAPGRYKLVEGDRATDLLGRAGGAVRSPSSEGEQWSSGDLEHCVLVRADGASRTLDLAAALTGAAGTDANPEIRPGDTLFIPELALNVSVMGHVVRPGRYVLRPGTAVSELLAYAGGPVRPIDLTSTTTSADLTHCELHRADGTTLALDLTSPGGPGLDAPLRPGDVLFVPEGRNSVMVRGYVTRPGYFAFRPGDSVRTAVHTAGGVLIEKGDPSHVEVRHTDGTTVSVNLDTADLDLRPGDEVYVPYGRLRVTVLGYVGSPGTFLWHEGDRVTDLLGAAQGISVSNGNRFRCAVVRQENGESRVIDIDLGKYYDTGSLEENIEVFPDDVLIVPRADHTNYQKWLTAIKDALTITNLVKAVF